MATIKGISVLVYEKTVSGADAFSHTTYNENPVEVQNVLVSPIASDDVISNTQLDGKHAEYELCIPKGDTHNWDDTKVEFYGQTWHTIGFPVRWIDTNVPLNWNAKIKVERYE